MIQIDFQEYIDNEYYVVRHSGETPEIALHSALYFLTEAEDGPGMELNEEQKRLLKRAAEERYREIVLRDLLPENRDRTIYRGVKRSIVNYQRYQCFCWRQQVEPNGFEREVAAALQSFLTNESAEVQRGARQSSINCTFAELSRFAAQVGLEEAVLPANLAELCCD